MWSTFFNFLKHLNQQNKYNSHLLISYLLIATVNMISIFNPYRELLIPWISMFTIVICIYIEWNRSTSNNSYLMAKQSNTSTSFIQRRLKDMSYLFPLMVEIIFSILYECFFTGQNISTLIIISTLYFFVFFLVISYYSYRCFIKNNIEDYKNLSKIIRRNSKLIDTYTHRIDKVIKNPSTTNISHICDYLNQINIFYTELLNIRSHLCQNLTQSQLIEKNLNSDNTKELSKIIKTIHNAEDKYIGQIENITSDNKYIAFIENWENAKIK